MDINNRVNDIIVITSRLIELLEKENDALRNQRTNEVHELLDEKTTLSRVYETRFMGLIEQEGAMDEVDPDLREQLGEIGTTINALIEDNSRLLKVAIEANRRVVELVAEAVRETSPNAGTYGANGTTGIDRRLAATNGATLSLDQTL